MDDSDPEVDVSEGKLDKDDHLDVHADDGEQEEIEEPTHAPTRETARLLGSVVGVVNAGPRTALVDSVGDLTQTAAGYLAFVGRPPGHSAPSPLQAQMHALAPRFTEEPKGALATPFGVARFVPPRDGLPGAICMRIKLTRTPTAKRTARALEHFKSCLDQIATRCEAELTGRGPRQSATQEAWKRGIAFPSKVCCGCNEAAWPQFREELDQLAHRLKHHGVPILVVRRVP